MNDRPWPQQDGDPDQTGAALLPGHHADWAGVLAPDEYVLWQGAPSRRMRRKRKLYLGIALGIAFTLASFMVLLEDPDRPVSLVMGFLMPFAIVAIGGWHFALRRALDLLGVTYTLTNKRVFLAYEDSKGRKSLDHCAITPKTYAQMTDTPPQRITIPPSPTNPLNMDDDARKLRLHDLEDGLEVYRMILRIRQGGS